MTERQRLIARKLAMQGARNRLRSMEGLEALDLLEREGRPELDQLLRDWLPAFLNGQPASRLDYRAPEAEVHQWLLENLDLTAGEEYYYPIGSVWARVRVLDPSAALRSLWAKRDFMLVETDLSRMLGAGFDSRDEYHFLIDILDLPTSGLAPGEGL